MRGGQFLLGLASFGLGAGQLGAVVGLELAHQAFHVGAAASPWSRGVLAGAFGLIGGVWLVWDSVGPGHVRRRLPRLRLELPPAAAPPVAAEAEPAPPTGEP